MTEVNKIVRTLMGTVVSDKMQKTIVVAIERRVKHRLGKYIKKTTRVFAHDETGAAVVGDRVSIRMSRPLSKKKAWVLDRVLQKAVVDAV